MLYVEICSWEKYNPRNDAKAWSWFRFENDFFDDEGLFDLSGPAKLLLIYLFTRRNRAGRVIFKINPAHAASRIDATQEVFDRALRALADCGVVAIHSAESFKDSVNAQVDVRGRTDPNVDVRGRTDPYPTDVRTNITDETNTTDTTDKTESPAAPRVFGPQDLAAVWNSYRGLLPAVAKLTDKRRQKASARLLEEAERDYWVDAVQRLARSAFATGKNDREWKADFDWLVANDTSHVKVAEGKYDDRGPAKAKGPTYRVLGPEDAL